MRKRVMISTRDKQSMILFIFLIFLLTISSQAFAWVGVKVVNKSSLLIEYTVSPGVVVVGNISTTGLLEPGKEVFVATGIGKRNVYWNYRGKRFPGECSGNYFTPEYWSPDEIIIYDNGKFDMYERVLRILTIGGKHLNQKAKCEKVPEWW